jgi:hypothetical protein
VVTLTATVTAGTTPVSPGQVKFCDATAAHCEDIHIVGFAQLTSAGTAVVRFRPGVGSHSYNAVFLGTPNGSPAYAGSASANGSLTVSAPTKYPSLTQMSVAGSTGSYQLGATVSGIGASPPTGTVSFLDTSNANAVLGTASLSNASSSFGLVNVSNPTTGPFPRAIAVADFNGDGIPDLAIVNEGSDSGGSTLTILLGNGDGTFTTGASTAVGFLAAALVVGDFNGDGIPDLAVMNYQVSTITILLGNGDGTFTAAASPSIGFMLYPQLITVGDFNGDGNLDLAVLSADDGGIAHAFQVTIMLGRGDGTFTTGPTTSLTGGEELDLTFTSVGVADLNRDGKLDFIAASEPSDVCFESNCSEASLSILLGNGDGTFNPSTIDLGPSPIYLGTVVAADFNGDGIPDLAVAGGANNVGFVDLLQGNGDGTFTSQSQLNVGAGFITDALAVGDFDGNGIADLALPYDYFAVSGDSSGVMLFFGKGDGTFNSPPYQFPLSGVISSCCSAAALAVGDFNGDGLEDVAPGLVLLSQTQFDAAPPVTPIVLNGVGTHLIAASYQGDANYSASTSGTTALNLSSGAPTVSLTLSSNPVNYGIPETSTVVVSGSGPTPTGTVTVTYNGLPGVNPQSQPCAAPRITVASPPAL